MNTYHQPNRARVNFLATQFELEHSYRKGMIEHLVLNEDEFAFEAGSSEDFFLRVV